MTIYSLPIFFTVALHTLLTQNSGSFVLSPTPSRLRECSTAISYLWTQREEQDIFLPPIYALDGAFR